MAKFARFDPAVTGPSPVIGWYDMDGLDYPNPPPSAELIELTDAQWNDIPTSQWAVQNGALVHYTPPPPPPPTVQQQAMALLATPVTVVCTELPALNGTYPIDQATQAQINGIASAIGAGLGLPSGGDTFNWPDVSFQPHQWPAAEFTAFAKAVMRHLYDCAQVAQGHGTTLPSTTLTI
jgi:hypothetical protein